MGIGGSIFLVAVGAILTFGITVDSDSTGTFNIDTIGVILMIVGAVGVILSMMFWNSWGGFGRRDQNTTVIHDREVL